MVSLHVSLLRKKCQIMSPNNGLFVFSSDLIQFSLININIPVGTYYSGYKFTMANVLTYFL